MNIFGCRIVNSGKILFRRQCNRIINPLVYSTLSINNDNSLKEITRHRPFNYLTHNHFINTKIVTNEDGFVDRFFNKFIKKAGWLPHVKARLRYKGYLLYESIADEISYEEWIKEYELSNTFISWFVVTEIHVWMLLVRCMADGGSGRNVRNAIIEAMWADVTLRAKKLYPLSSSLVRKHVDELSEQFQAAIVGYDEGLMTNDTILAGALWRRFFLMKEEDPRKIERLIIYIRKQVLLLDKMPTEALLKDPKINWLPLNDK